MLTPYPFAIVSTLSTCGQSNTYPLERAKVNLPVNELFVRVVFTIVIAHAEIMNDITRTVPLDVQCNYRSDSARFVVTPTGRARNPRARGDHEIEPTPKCCKNFGHIEELNHWNGTYFQCWEHFSLILTIHKVIVILHRDERGQVVVDRIIWKILLAVAWSRAGHHAYSALRGLKAKVVSGE